MSLLTLFQLDLEVASTGTVAGAVTTSGTIATTNFTTQQVIDHAFRRCKMAPQEITSEHLETARELLWLILQPLNQRGIMMHVVETQLLGLNDSVANLLCNPGTLNIYFANLRTISRLSGAASASSGTAANAFDGDIATSCAAAVFGATIDLALSSASALTTVGVLPAVTDTWTFDLQTSNDGVIWTSVLSKSALAVTAGTWLWYDIPGVSSTSYLRMQAGIATTLNVSELVWGNSAADVPLSLIDRDSYDALPNKFQPGRPVQYWFNRQRINTYMTLYPSPSSAFTITSLIAARVQRQIMDVGALTQELELPSRWFLPVVADLARNLAAEIKEVDSSMIPALDARADQLIAQAWDGESDGSPIVLLPNLRAYRA